MFLISSPRSPALALGGDEVADGGAGPDASGSTSTARTPGQRNGSFCGEATEPVTGLHTAQQLPHPVAQLPDADFHHAPPSGMGVGQSSAAGFFVGGAGMNASMRAWGRSLFERLTNSSTASAPLLSGWAGA